MYTTLTEDYDANVFYFNARLAYNQIVPWAFVPWALVCRGWPEDAVSGDGVSSSSAPDSPGHCGTRRSGPPAAHRPVTDSSFSCCNTWHDIRERYYPIDTHHVITQFLMHLFSDAIWYSLYTCKKRLYLYWSTRKYISWFITFKIRAVIMFERQWECIYIQW